MKPLPQKYVMGCDLSAGPVCYNRQNHLYLNVPAPQLRGMCSCCIVNNGIVYIDYEFEPDWDAGDISEEDRA